MSKIGSIGTTLEKCATRFFRLPDCHGNEKLVKILRDFFHKTCSSKSFSNVLAAFSVYPGCTLEC
jgi:hypothetical protein